MPSLRPDKAERSLHSELGWQNIRSDGVVRVTSDDAVANQQFVAATDTATAALYGFVECHCALTDDGLSAGVCFVGKAGDEQAAAFSFRTADRVAGKCGLGEDNI